MNCCYELISQLADRSNIGENHPLDGPPYSMRDKLGYGSLGKKYLKIIHPNTCSRRYWQIIRYMDTIPFNGILIKSIKAIGEKPNGTEGPLSKGKSPKQATIASLSILVSASFRLL